MDNMKKEVMDGMQDYFDKMMKRLDEKQDNLKETMKELITKEIGEVKKQMTDMNKELQENSKKLQEVETLTIDIDKRVAELTEENERLKILLEAKSMDKQIRIRGIPEEKDEMITQKLAEIFSEFLEQPVEEISSSIV